MTTKELLAACDRLADPEHEGTLTDRELAPFLKPFGIGPKDLRRGREVLKGYERSQFEDAWARYAG